MAHFKYQKTLLAVSAIAALGGTLVNAQAQAVNDRGNLNFIAQINATTCVLDLGDSAATAAGNRNVNLGTFTTSSTSGVAAGTNISPTTTVTLSLKDATGSANCNLGTTKWDIGVDLQAAAYSTTAIAGKTVLTNQSPSSVAATNVALSITRSVSGAAAAAVDFSVKTSVAYGTLLSGNTQPALGPTDTIAINATLQKSGTNAVTPGAFTASLPLIVFYR